MENEWALPCSENTQWIIRTGINKLFVLALCQILATFHPLSTRMSASPSITLRLGLALGQQTVTRCVRLHKIGSLCVCAVLMWSWKICDVLATRALYAWTRLWLRLYFNWWLCCDKIVFFYIFSCHRSICRINQAALNYLKCKCKEPAYRLCIGHKYVTVNYRSSLGLTVLPFWGRKKFFHNFY